MAKGITIAYSFLTIIVLGGFAFFFTILQPQIRAVRQTAQQITDTRLELAEQESFLSTIDQKLQQLQTNQQHENQLALILPATERSEDYLRIIHQASGLSGVSIGRLNNQTASLRSQLNAQVARGNGGGLPEATRPVGWQFDFSGSYQQFRAFLQELERSPRLLDVLQISLSRNQSDPNSVTGRMTTQFYQYEAPEDL